MQYKRYYLIAPATHPARLFLSSFSPSYLPPLQKILTMIPTEEEKQRIQEAQLINPDVPLGSAEQFLLTLSSITELSARLQLWAFKMDYELTEKVRHPSAVCLCANLMSESNVFVTFTSFNPTRLRLRTFNECRH